MSSQTTIDDKYALCALCLLGLWAVVGCGPSTSTPTSSGTAAQISLSYSSGTVGTGGTISKAFERPGIPALEAYGAQQALNKVFRLRSAQADHRYELWRSTSGSLVRFVYWPNAFEFYSVDRSQTGAYVSTHQTVPITQERMAARGSIKTSLWDAMKEQNTLALNWKFAEIFGSRIDFLTEPRVGDSFRLVWSRDRHDAHTREGEIECASYRRHNGEEIFAFLLEGEYYDQNGRSMRGQFLRAPLSYRRISSGFTNARFHPILRYYRPHHGIDYAAAYGTPVQSIGEGHVIFAGWDKGLGQAVRVRHAGSYVSIYGHLSRFAPGIRSGVSVQQGQYIGRVGSTGLSTGPHLHFGFERAGRLVNFLGIKFEQKARTVPPELKEQFTAAKKEGLRILSTLDAPTAAHTLPE